MNHLVILLIYFNFGKKWPIYFLGKETNKTSF